MAEFENFKGAFTNLASTTITWTDRISSFILAVEGDDAYFEPDGDAVGGAGGSRKIFKDTEYSLNIPCLTIGIMGVSGAGTYEILGIPFAAGMTMDIEAEQNRGYVHVSHRGHTSA